MTLKEFARRVNRSPQHIYNLAQAGRLPEARKVGCRWVFGEDAPAVYRARNDKLLQRTLAVVNAPDYRLGSSFPPEVIAKQQREARALRARIAYKQMDPATRARHKAAVNAAWTPERRAAASATARARWADPAKRAKLVAAQAAAAADPGNKLKRKLAANKRRGAIVSPVPGP